jgi:two-component system, cell cycle sensor histidine kinase and response regulator CckA
MLASIERALREKDERESRRKAELALHRREEEFRLLIENTLDIISVLDRDGRFTFNSPSIERVLGYRPEELILTEAVSLVHPDDLGLARDAFARAFASPNELTVAEMRVRHKSGAWRNVELIGKALQPGAVFEGIVVNSRDVTEKRETEAQFLRAQRLECLGVLAGGIAHDLNNILAPIVMGTELLKTTVADQDALSIIETMHSSAHRGSDLVKHVLSFARGVKGDSSVLDIKPMFREVAKLIRETFPKSIQLQLQLDEGLHPILCNPTELHQVLMNLCINARDAMPDGGLLQLKAKNVSLDARQLLRHPDAQPGDYVRMSVADSGTGIPPDVLNQIFEPFFTTKAEGKGTGLGLSTVLSIIKRNAGIIEVESVPGEGTQFHIYFRRAEASDPGRLDLKVPAMRGNREQILLVDDESAILEMAKAILESANYDVLIASEGVQALRTMAGFGRHVDLVITDAAMPVMDGPTLVKELHRLNPELPIICATGQGSGNLRTRVIDAGVQQILNKPYAAKELLTAVHDVLHPVK